MEQARHLVHRLVMELTTPDEASGRQVQDAMARALPKEAMERCFNTVAPSGTLLRLDRLVLDLGRLDPEHLERELERRVVTTLTRALGDATANMDGVGSDPREASLDLVTQFSRTGTVPWWADLADPDLLTGHFDALFGLPVERLRAAATAWVQTPESRHRLVGQLPLPRVAHLTARLARMKRETMERDVGRLVHGLQSAGFGHALPDDTRRWAWERALVASLKPDGFHAALIDAFAEGLGLPAALLATRILEVLDRAEPVESTPQPPPGASSQAPTDEPPVPVQDPLRLALFRYIPPPQIPEEEGLGLPDVGRARTGKGTRPGRDSLPPQVESEGAQEGLGLPAALLATRILEVLDRAEPVESTPQPPPGASSQAPTDEPPVPVQDPLRLALFRYIPPPQIPEEEGLGLPDVGRARTGKGTRPGRDSLPPQVESEGAQGHYPVRRQEGSLRPPWAVAGDPDLPVLDAGLVLLWPFLSTLFGRLGLLDDDRRFKGHEAANRAVRLLHHLATGGDEPAEVRLVLHKVLCGLPVEHVFQGAHPLEPAEREACEGLLDGVIAHATILRSMSRDGLRGTFLLRAGMLSLRDGLWLLRVERRSYDLVLERFPWTWSWVHFPWLDAPLRVEW